MNDRELLELAAKAAGIDVSRLDLHPMNANSWNPLTDDGDALRLAVKLGIYIGKSALSDGRRFAHAQELETPFYEDAQDDPYAATRRAIVRAAAEIGKTQPTST